MSLEHANWEFNKASNSSWKHCISQKFFILPKKVGSFEPIQEISSNSNNIFPDSRRSPTAHIISKRLLLNMNKTQKGIIHIIGIGGIGMSAIAEILHNSNCKIQGSDAQSNNNVDRLQRLGIEVFIGHNANNISQAQIVVHSSAIESDNVELITARNNNKTILHRSDILTEIMEDKYVIAVSGSSGKTTTTAMIASIFDHSDIDATVIVGGILNSYQSNSRLGRSNIFLIEADESDGTMLKIPANIAVITSINDDHMDHYGTFDDIKNAFSQFINKAGFAVLPDSVGINYDASVKLIEDYAHHPNEIYATLTAARSITKGKVIGIIEPLRFARIRNFFDEFIRIFMMFDYVILTPVHPPEDKPIPGCGIDDIQEALISNGFNNVKIMNDSLLISHFISNSTNSGDVVLFIGAGSNIDKLAKEAAALIAEVKV
uniref:UDP-N-acetylmuramate--L-alanine ligase n=1 Tax=Glossina austeni TaxID=7395 RepID=A0A1A9VKB5_GLOAU